MPQVIHDFVVNSLLQTDIRKVASETGIAQATLQKIRYRHIKNPGIKSMEQLYWYFRDREGHSLRQKVALRRQGKRA